MVLVMKTTTGHAFEIAGLGQAPFRLVRTYEAKFQAAPGEPVKAGASCDYCSTSIMRVCVIRDAMGHEFKVGCDCVAKTGDVKLVRRLDAARLDIARKQRAARAASTSATLEAWLSDPTVRGKLSALPHPKMATKTLLDYAEFMAARAGAKGRAKVAKMLSGLLAA